jgi:hypothetical protein
MTEEKAKHTPEPWQINWDEDGKSSEIVGRGIIVEPIAIIPHDDVTDEGILEVRANARLITAAPKLLEAQIMGAQVNTPDFLDWIADRLVNVYGESSHVDFVLSLRERAAVGRTAINIVRGYI